MPIYEKPVRAILPDMIADLASDPSMVFTREEAVRWFADHYPKIRNSTVAAHLIRFSTNAPSRLHYNVQPGEDLLFQIDGGRFRRFDSAHDPAPIHPASEERTTAPSEDPVDTEPPSEFAYERDLQQFLARNLSLIERGLQLYEEEGIPGIEFPVGGRFVDILALDAQRNFVVVELKVSKAYDRVVGQLLRYMAWVKANHAEAEQSVRGIIVAREISNDLRLACSQVPNVALYEYKLSVSLSRVVF
jgi:endonuclease